MGVWQKPNNGGALGGPTQFTGILRGDYESGVARAVSVDPELRIILRDPVGDNSFSTITQGSVVGMDHKRELNSAGIVGFEDEATTGISVESTSEQEINTSPFGIGITLTGNGNTTTVGGGLAMKLRRPSPGHGVVLLSVLKKSVFEQSISTPVDRC